MEGRMLMKSYSGMTKTGARLLCLALFASLAITTTAFADDDEDDGLPKKAYSLGQERPKPKPKPKVIIKEKIVEKMVCPSGSTWNGDVKKCQDEDGNDVIVTPKSKKKQQVAQEESEPAVQKNSTRIPDEKYVYPRTKVRVRVGQCIMTGESMTCDISYINTAAGATSIHIDTKSTSIIDNLGNKFFQTSSECDSFDCRVSYGHAGKHKYKFTYLDTRATSVTFSTVLKANGETDLIKLENFPITK